MTGSDIYNAALALTGEPPTSQGDYETSVVIGLLNILLSEVFPYNQIFRESRGEEQMKEALTL